MRREGWWALLLLGVGGLFAVDRVAESYWDYPAASGELPEAARAYRAAGLPWTADALRTGIRPEENAAPEIRAAIRALPDKKTTDAVEDRATYGEPVGSLGRFTTVFRLVHAAVRKPRLDFARDWDQGAQLLFPEEAGVKSLGKLLTIRAEESAKQGDDEAAIDDLDDARRLAFLIGSEPIIISALVGASGESSVLAGARACLVEAARNPVRLRRYRAWLLRAPSLPDLNQALRGEVYLSVVNVRNFDLIGVGQGFLPTNDWIPFADTPEDLRGDYSHDPKPPFIRRDGYPENTRSRAYMTRCLQTWTELAQATHQLSDSTEAIGTKAARIEAEVERRRGLSYAFESILFPVFEQFGRTNQARSAARALSLDYADALIYHAEAGRWPSHSEMPDPLGKGPLKLRVGGDRFRVWSVGRNGKDEGGLMTSEKRAGHQSDDLAAVYPPLPPPKRPLSSSSLGRSD